MLDVITPLAVMCVTVTLASHLMATMVVWVSIDLFMKIMSDNNIIFFTDVDECRAGIHACDENADCTKSVGSFNCSCRSAYIGDGFTCIRK